MSTRTMNTDGSEEAVPQINTMDKGSCVGTESGLQSEGMDRGATAIQYAADMTGADHEDKRWPVPEPEAGLCLQQNEHAEPTYQFPELEACIRRSIIEPEAGLFLQQAQGDNLPKDPSDEAAAFPELEASITRSFLPDLEKKSNVERGKEVGEGASFASGQQGTAFKDLCTCNNGYLQRQVDDLESELKRVDGKLERLIKGYSKHCVAANMRRLKGNKEKGE